MPSYRFAEDLVCSPESVRWAETLARAYRAKERPLCMCRPRGVEAAMYIAAVKGAHVVKRMPLSGALHASHCEHYEAPPELSGLGQVVGHAIREDPEAEITTLTLDFALSRGPSRTPAASATAERESVRSDGTKLTLRATLHYLWDEADLTRWSPRMAGRRSWAVVQRELIAAAANKVTKGQALGELLFVPETFQSEDVAGIKARRGQKLARLSDSASARMLLIAEVKALEPARFGHRLVCKHLPDMPLQVNDDLYRRLTTVFRPQLALWTQLEETHLLLIGVFSQAVPGAYELESACLVNVNAGWLPFESAQEHELLEALAARRFTKGQRYNMPTSRPLASTVLNDTAEPTALYLVPVGASEGFDRAIEELALQSGLASWWWRAKDGPMPRLPDPRVAGADQAGSQPPA